MKQYHIAVIPGDGIGKEVIHKGIRVVDAAASRFGFQMNWVFFDWSCAYYQKHGRMMPPDGIAQLAAYDAIFLGAVGFPGVPGHFSLWGLLIPIRREFHQYVSLRPVRLLPGVEAPVKRKVGEIDLMIVRENIEGEYSKIGGRIYEGTDAEMALQESVFTRKGVDRILEYAFKLAQERPARHLTSATKSNGIFHTMPFWDERFKAMAASYPDVRVDQYHIDILCAHFVMHPDRFDVVVASNQSTAHSLEPKGYSRDIVRRIDAMAAKGDSCFGKRLGLRPLPDRRSAGRDTRGNRVLSRARFQGGLRGRTEIIEEMEGHGPTHPCLEQIPIQIARRDITEGRELLQQFFRQRRS